MPFIKDKIKIHIDWILEKQPSAPLLREPGTHHLDGMPVHHRSSLSFRGSLKGEKHLEGLPSLYFADYICYLFRIKRKRDEHHFICQFRKTNIKLLRITVSQIR